MIDEQRIPHEIRTALEVAGHYVELLEPGLNLRPDGDDLVVVDCHGDDLARFAAYRIAPLDPERLRRTAAAALEGMPVDLADQCVAAINAGDVELHDPPDDDVVRCDIPIGDRVVILFVAHRRVLVPSWPEDPEGA